MCNNSVKTGVVVMEFSRDMHGYARIKKTGHTCMAMQESRRLAMVLWGANMHVLP